MNNIITLGVSTDKVATMNAWDAGRKIPVIVMLAGDFLGLQSLVIDITV